MQAPQVCFDCAISLLLLGSLLIISYRSFDVARGNGTLAPIGTLRRRSCDGTRSTREGDWAGTSGGRQRTAASPVATSRWSAGGRSPPYVRAGDRRARVDDKTGA